MKIKLNGYGQALFLMVLFTPIAPALVRRATASVSALPSAPEESVREELIRTQSKAGLTLAWYDNGLRYVAFDRRSIHEGKNPPGFARDSNGVVSRDGAKIALSRTFIEVGRKPVLGIVRIDGSNLRQYPEVSPGEMCWSYDGLKMAITSSSFSNRTMNVSVEIFNLSAKETSLVERPAYRDPDFHFTSQCWSPDDKQVVYGAGGNVRVYELATGKLTVLIKGTNPSWSPDGNWIAFYDHDAFYAIHPSGEGRKKLFHKKGASTGLLWSPNSRIVAYVSESGLGEGSILENYRLRVRRLEDNSEDWVADTVPCCEKYQWVENPNLVSDTKGK